MKWAFDIFYLHFFWIVYGQSIEMNCPWKNAYKLIKSDQNASEYVVNILQSEKVLTILNISLKQ